MWQWLAEGDAVTWATAALMLLMSVLSWVVILYKLWFMAVARRGVPQAVAAFWQMPDLVQAMAQVKALDRQGLVQAMADAVAQGGMAAQGSLAQSAAQGQRLLRSLREALGQASVQLQWGQTLLATIGATAPLWVCWVRSGAFTMRWERWRAAVRSISLSLLGLWVKPWS
jgi:biopolymer transport protein ExbB